MYPVTELASYDETKELFKAAILEVEKFLKHKSDAMLNNDQNQILKNLQVKLMTSYKGLKLTIKAWETWRAHGGYTEEISLLHKWKRYIMAMSGLVELMTQRITMFLNTNDPRASSSYLDERVGIGEQTPT
jgi:hypothetical protein